MYRALRCGYTLDGGIRYPRSTLAIHCLRTRKPTNDGIGQPGLSRDHFFQLSNPASTIDSLVDSMLQHLCAEVALPITTTILPIEVEEDAILVQHTGANWAVALSRRQRQCLRRQPGRHTIGMLISTHLRISAANWRAVAGTGYCGYEAIRQMLCSRAHPSCSQMKPYAWPCENF